MLPVQAAVAQTLPLPLPPDPPLPIPDAPDLGPAIVVPPATAVPTVAPQPTVVPQTAATPQPALASDTAPFRVWHFAEGNSRNGFETYFSLLNLSDKPASVSALYNRDDGIRLTQWLGIEPGARISLNANDVVGARAFGASFYGDQDIVVERTTIWGPGQNGETLVGYPSDGRLALRGGHHARPGGHLLRDPEPDGRPGRRHRHLHPRRRLDREAPV
jgi:hypothetical protein